MIQGICTAAAGLPRSCAAPAGGALLGGRGRHGAKIVALAASMTAALRAEAESRIVPSGREIALIEYVADEDGQGAVLRARYHAPDLDGSEDMDAVFADMAHLCEHDAMAVQQGMDTQPPRIIISLSSQPIAFGTSDPSVVQYFEAYRIEDGRCVWELF